NLICHHQHQEKERYQKRRPACNGLPGARSGQGIAQGGGNTGDQYNSKCHSAKRQVYQRQPALDVRVFTSALFAYSINVRRGAGCGFLCRWLALGCTLFGLLVDQLHFWLLWAETPNGGFFNPSMKCSRRGGKPGSARLIGKLGFKTL